MRIDILTLFPEMFEAAREGRMRDIVATIQADQVAIASKLAGYVRTVAVDDNQQVAAGMLLVEIDPSLAQARVYVGSSARVPAARRTS